MGAHLAAVVDIVQAKTELEAENVEAVAIGAATNLDRHIRNMAGFGIPVIVSINKFTSDTDAEIKALSDAAHASGARSVTITEVHSKGGEGGEDLANAVVKAIQDHVAAGRPFTPLFYLMLQLWKKSKPSQQGCIRLVRLLLKQMPRNS